MPINRVILMALAGLQILLGFYLIRYGVLAGLVERCIRTNKYSQEKVTGRTAVSWGLFYMLLGMVLMMLATFLLMGALGA